MPPWLRIATLGLFGGVAGMVGLQMCYGTLLFGTTSAVVLAEHAPTAEDRQLAEELRSRAAAHGEELDVGAIEIAQARRLGQLELVEQFADERFPQPVTPRPVEPHRMDGAFYRDEPTEPASGFPWVWAAAAVGALLASVAALAAAFFALAPSRSDT